MSANKKIDMDLLALAGITKAGLRDIDAARVGGGSHRADNIDLKKLAGVDQQGRPNLKGPNVKAPNILKGLDFIEPPKSRPLGAVNLDGTPIQEKVDFMPVPQDMQENIQHQLEFIAEEKEAPPQQPQNPVPNPVEESAVPIPNNNMDFDLFEYTILKEIVKNLDSSIDSLDQSLVQLKAKRELILKMIEGKKNE